MQWTDACLVDQSGVGQGNQLIGRPGLCAQVLILRPGGDCAWASVARQANAMPTQARLMRIMAVPPTVEPRSPRSVDGHGWTQRYILWMVGVGVVDQKACVSTHGREGVRLQLQDTGAGAGMDERCADDVAAMRDRPPSRRYSKAGRVSWHQPRTGAGADQCPIVIEIPGFLMIDPSHDIDSLSWRQCRAWTIMMPCNHGDSAAKGRFAADRRVLVTGAQAPMR